MVKRTKEVNESLERMMRRISSDRGNSSQTRLHWGVALRGSKSGSLIEMPVPNEGRAQGSKLKE